MPCLSCLRMHAAETAIESRLEVPVSFDCTGVQSLPKSQASTYLSILFVIDDISCPVLDDQLGQLRWQESYLRKWFDVHLSFFKNSLIIISNNKTISVIKLSIIQLFEIVINKHKMNINQQADIEELFRRINKTI